MNESIFHKELIKVSISIPFNIMGKNLKQYFENYAVNNIEGMCRNEGYVKSNSSNDHEMIETSKSVFTVISIRISDDSILPVDDHRMDTLAALIEGRDFGDAFALINRCLIEI